MTTNCLYCKQDFQHPNLRGGLKKFCSRKCKDESERKVPTSEMPKVVHLYSVERMTAENIALRYNCTPTVIKKILRRFSVEIRLGAQSGVNNHRYGVKHTLESRAKMRDANRKQFEVPGARERHAELTVNQIKNGNTGKVYNKLEVAFAKLLDELGIEYRWQVKHKRYLFDFQLVETNCMVEVHGKFWHADKRYYSHDNLTPIQQRNVLNDEVKRKAAIEAGYSYLAFWEDDVHANPEMVKAEILRFINPQT